MGACTPKGKGMPGHQVPPTDRTHLTSVPPFAVIPAKAGIHVLAQISAHRCIPGFAGMTHRARPRFFRKQLATLGQALVSALLWL